LMIAFRASVFWPCCRGGIGDARSVLSHLAGNAGGEPELRYRQDDGYWSKTSFVIGHYVLSKVPAQAQ